MDLQSKTSRLEAAIRKEKRGHLSKARDVPPFKRTELSADAPAPRTQELIAERGAELSTRALEAWAARLNGTSMIEVAHGMGVSLDSAKALIREAHAAIAEDLKENLNLNRELDLARIDGLLSTYYRSAREGDLDSANLVLKALSHRAKLTGAEPPQQIGRTQGPENVLIWIQQQMPSINKIVDSLPIE